MIELVVPAGNLEKLKYAFVYGADAVYLGGKEFSLRAGAENFELDEIKEAVSYAHDLNKKVYVAVNIFARNSDENALTDYLLKLYELGIDAAILSDPGVIYLAKKIVPNLKLHLSTQANTTNKLSSSFWKDQGIKRIVLARELNIREIKDIAHKDPGMEFEIFVHGAMCISYSGRCFLSAYLANRDANKGDCAHPCRWKYALLEEQKRKGEYLYYEEDTNGVYIFNTKDLCLIDHIPQLIDTGVTAFKIEGRMKSLYYLIVTTRAYRHAIDLAYNNTNKNELKRWRDELDKLNHRGYTTGFYLDSPTHEDYDYKSSETNVFHYFIGQVLEQLDSKKIKILVKNTISKDETIELITPTSDEDILTTIESIEYQNKSIEKANPNSIVTLTLTTPIKTPNFTILRKPK